MSINLESGQSAAPVESAIDVQPVTAESIAGWIDKLAMFLLVVYVLLIVAGLVASVVVISAEKPPRQGRSPNGQFDHKNSTTGLPMTDLLLNVPFIGGIFKSILDDDQLSPKDPTSKWNLMAVAEKFLMETFKTTLVVVLAWVSVKVIISIVLFVSSNAVSITGR
jgi:hypothetical protein